MLGWASTNTFPNPAVADFPALHFRPSGGTGGPQAEIYLSEGWVEDVNTDSGTVGEPFFPPGDYMLFSLDVYNLTGIMRVRDYN